MLLLITLAFGTAASDIQAGPPLASCEAPAGDYKMVPLASPLDGVFSISGRLRLNTTQVGTKWLPAGGAFFELDAKHSYAGFQVYVDPDRPKVLTLGIRRPAAKRVDPIGYAPFGSWVAFQVNMAGDSLSVTLNGVSKTVPAKSHRPTKRLLTCSSGSFEFEALQPAVAP